MTHEPECLPHIVVPLGRIVCICDRIRAAYRRGYNDHARSVQHWQDTHGAYRMADQATEPVVQSEYPEPPRED